MTFTAAEGMWKGCRDAQGHLHAVNIVVPARGLRQPSDWQEVLGDIERALPRAVVLATHRADNRDVWLVTVSHPNFAPVLPYQRYDEVELELYLLKMAGMS